MTNKPILSLPARLDESTADKLALILWYVTGVQAGRIDADPMALDSLLDDAEVMNWLDRMNKAGRIKNTRFTQPSRGSHGPNGGVRHPFMRNRR